MSRVFFYESWLETRGRSRRRSSGQAFRVEAMRRQPGPNASAQIEEAVRSWPEPELVLRSERWAEGGLGLKRVLWLLVLDFRVGPEERKAVFLGRALAWKPVPEGPQVYEPNIYHRSELDPFLYDRKSNATYIFPRHLSVEHVVFS